MFLSNILKKQHRQLAATTAQLLSINGGSVAPKFFSTAAATTPDEKAKEEWGEKYSDECFQFEKEWEAIAGKIEKEQRVYLESELGDLQRKKVEMIADKLLDMNMFELRYFALICKERIQKTSGINPLKMNLDWPSVKRDDTGSWPPANPNWFK